MRWCAAWKVLGEAAGHIPGHCVLKRPVFVKYMAGMRNKLIHEYFGVDLSIVWTVIKTELPLFAGNRTFTGKAGRKEVASLDRDISGMM